ncbi:aldo/keto reductase [Halobacteriovorax sp. HLS]|uniref:aldo/keto reductase n=1 Tax=Halobacteriovorax sp. HLS TaxID=2234000 RepID=UPI000FD9A4DB|nr:aldo/keto reductase [Halobacteriovorax sp. HLS]
MKYNNLGKTEISVSEICLGTMTFGQQNTEAESHEILDYALDNEVNFFDTAEMYPIPPNPKTVHRTEQYIGNWDKFKTQRDKIIMATKVVGPGEFVKHIRGGPKLNKEHIFQAVEGSLKRLGTDYIDLYQIHWPDRSTNFFGQREYTHNTRETMTPIEEILGALKELKDQGKIREIGVSNETSWGVMKYLQIAKELNLPLIQSIQNPYNLLNRTFEINLSEISHREDVGLLAYSPLGFGVLSGKYLDGSSTQNSRLNIWKHYSRYSNELAQSATLKYMELAKENGLSPTQLALAFVNTRPFLTANIIGATSIKQLEENLTSATIELSNEVLEKINQIHSQSPNPAP